MIVLFILVVILMSGSAIADNENIQADSKLAQLSALLVDAAWNLDLCTSTNLSKHRRSGSRYEPESFASQDAHYFFLTTNYLKDHALVNASYDHYWEQLCASDTAFHNLMHFYQGSDEMMNSCLKEYDNAALSKDAVFMRFRQNGYEPCYHYGEHLTPLK